MVNILDIIGDKWSLVVVRDIFIGRKSFGEFLASPEKISTSVLTSRLRLLERAGIIKHVFSNCDKKVKWYYLTDRGIDLFPILFEMIFWSKRNLNKEFHVLFQKWLKKYESLTPVQTIIENQNNYKEKRKELFEMQ